MKDDYGHKMTSAQLAFLDLSSDIETDSSQIISTELFTTSQVPPCVH